MANRACLFPTGDPNRWELDSSGEVPYYDSRHTIPIGWWLLFKPSDLRQIEHASDSLGREWRVLRFRSERREAVDRFSRRRPWLDRLVMGRVSPREVDFFESVLRRWPGEFLVMDPDEILQGSVDASFAYALKAVQFLSVPYPDPDAFLRHLGEDSVIPSESDDENQQTLKVLGVTYGDFADRLRSSLEQGPGSTL